MADCPQKIKPHLFHSLFDPQRDLNLCFAWANDQEVVQYLPSMPRPLSWEKHLAWANTVLRGDDRRDFMLAIASDAPAVVGLRMIGRVHAAQIRSRSPEIGVLIGDKTTWGLGFATEGIRIMCEDLAGGGPWLQCHALIHPENAASVKAFEKNGFVRRAKDGINELGRGNQLIFDKVLRS